MAANRHINSTRAKLYADAQTRAGVMLAGESPDPVDTAHLLLALAMQLHDAKLAMHSGLLGTDAPLRARYRHRFDHLLRNARQEIIRAAADEVLGAGAQQWLRPDRQIDSAYQRAVESNAGLGAVLDELDALKK